jgi:hypothetical protein
MQGQPPRLSSRAKLGKILGVSEMADKRKLTGLGIALGAALGAVFGVMAGHVAIWLAVGVAIGVAVGVSLRSKAAECPECAAIHRTHEVERRA